MPHLRLLLLFSSIIACAWSAESAAPATDAPTPRTAEKPLTREEAFAKAGVKIVTGPATVKLGKVAELRLPQDYVFIGPDSIARFYELTKNVPNGKEVGVLIAPSAWMLFFDYVDVGYVKDDEKNALDAAKLMQSMTEGQESANEARKKRGWDEMKLQGWATPPHYDEKTHNLKWAFKLSSSQDGFKSVWINESIRLLGRGGVMNVTLVSETPTFAAAEKEADQLLASDYQYAAGQKYAEFKAGDKIAEYGLAALVVGGGAVLAAKAGLFANLGLLLGKAWKAVVVAVVALGAAIGRLWKKIVGKEEVK
jgi:uncharacterized membrane-anchored protein